MRAGAYAERRVAAVHARSAFVVETGNRTGSWVCGGAPIARRELLGGMVTFWRANGAEPAFEHGDCGKGGYARPK